MISARCEKNVFLQIQPLDYSNPSDTKREIYKYHQDGTLLVKIILDEDEDLFFDQSCLMDIDKEGNIYHLWIRKNGPILVKWTKVK